MPAFNSEFLVVSTASQNTVSFQKLLYPVAETSSVSVG